MKTGITFTSTKYYLTTYYTVICVLRGTIMGKPFKVTGKAKCSPNDSFEKEKGKRIAESRAKAKIYKIARNFYTDAYNTLHKTEDLLKRLADKCSFVYEREEEHIDKLFES